MKRETWLRMWFLILIGLGFLTGCSKEETDKTSTTTPYSTGTADSPANGAALTSPANAQPLPETTLEDAPWQVPFKKRAGSQLNLAYIGSLNAELEPCGCTVETDYGGLKRQARVLKALKAEFEPLVVLSSGGLLDDVGNNGRIKNTYLLKGMSMMPFDAIGVQPRDLTFGFSFIGHDNLPWVISNRIPAALLDGESSIENLGLYSHMSLYKAERDIVVFSIMPPEKLFSVNEVSVKEASVNETLKGKSIPEKDPAFLQAFEKIREHLAELRDSDTLVIVLSTVAPDALNAVLDLNAVDVIITPTEAETFAEPEHYGKTLWLQPGQRGMRIGVVQIDLLPVGGPGERLNVLNHNVIDLDNTVPDAVAMAEWYDQYNKAVAEDYEARSALQKKYQSGTEYLGVAVCEQCHQPVVTHWRTTDHSHAHQTLSDKGKALDPGCLKCHTVAFHQPGGFIDMTVSAHLANVQCENCHRATAAHVANPTVEKVPLAQETPEKTCMVCHNALHSPRFSFEAYWPRIAHDLSGGISENRENTSGQ